MLRRMPDAQLVQWREWCEGPIRNHVLNMHAHRYVWQQLQQIISENTNVPASYWWTFLQETYAASQAVAIRRQADVRKDVVSLGRLIHTVKANAAHLTRDRWMALWGADDLRHASAFWDAEFAGNISTHLDPAIPAADLRQLRETAKDVKGYADQHVAHTAESAVTDQITLTYDDLHAAIDSIGDLFRKYHHLLTGISYGRLVPHIYPSWTDVFKQPWMVQRPTT